MEFSKEKGRIYREDEGRLVAEVTFPEIREGVVAIDHTYVDGSLRGRGIGGLLMEAVYETLKADGRKAVLVCPFAVRWYAENPEKNDVTVQG